MSKIPMVRRNRVVNVDTRLAPLLERHGGYQRRDMQAQPAASLPPAQPESQAFQAKRAAAQPERDEAGASKAAAQAAAKVSPERAVKKAAKKAAAKTAANKPAPEKDASE